MIQEMIKAFMLIFIAEMGDKTQILAMAFAVRFPVKKVLLGIGIGAFLNHGLAVIVGSYLSKMISIDIVQMVAGFVFILFALWTLKPDEDDEVEEAKSKFGPVATVALAFFLGELGDKTQLTAITLAADGKYPALILAGTVLGMIATGALGIIVGKKLGDKIPELGIKLLAASIFMFFGMYKLFRTLPEQYMAVKFLVPFILLIGVIVFFMIRSLLRRKRIGLQSELIVKSKLIYDYYHHMEKDICNICLGSNHCKVCLGNGCAVGRAKKIIESSLKNSQVDLSLIENNDISHEKPFKKEEVIDSLVDTIYLIERFKDGDSIKNAQLIRNQLELILFGKTIDDFKDIKFYLDEVKKISDELASSIYGMYIIRKPIKNRMINVGNRTSNIYLIEIQEGYLLIDAGYKKHFDYFMKKLKKENIEVEEISYVFVTHAHSNHVGFLKEILEKTNAKVILHPESVKWLKDGHNSLNGGFISIFSMFFSKIARVFKKENIFFEKVDFPDRYITVTEETKSKIEKIISGEIVSLPGHTKDSIGIMFENKILFCGDAAMNRTMSKKRFIDWIEDIEAYKATWKEMIKLNFKEVYPAHGKPFDKEMLIKNEKELENINIYKNGSK